MPCRIPAARRQEQSPATSVFVSWAPTLPAKPIAQAIKNASIDPSHCLEAFPANAVVWIQFNFNGSASAGPYSEPFQSYRKVKSQFRLRLLQKWIFDFESSPAQFFFEPNMFSAGFLIRHAWPSQDFRDFFFRHANSDFLPRFGG